MKSIFLLAAMVCTASFSTLCAQQTDSTVVEQLDPILITVYRTLGGMYRMPDMKDNVIYAGKKTEVIDLNQLNADLSTNNTRQVFSKIPGMSIWENDGSGIQVGVASRGLSPNRSWEFNVRQNGYDISSEAFGYPESYFSPPMEALERIELVRGAASLQFGPQFGGLLNYQVKKGNPLKPLSFETQQTVGSYGLFNTYNAIGGTYKKISYYSYFHHRTAEGWRSNSRYNIYAGYFSVSYQVSKKIKISGEYTRMDYESQQPGGLTDIQFKENPRQSNRKRNWFGTPWNVASINFQYDISPALNFQLKSFATIAERNSVGFTKAINVNDTINDNTLQYNPRQLDRDYYRNFGTEARLAVKYLLFGKQNTLAAGLRAYSGNTDRKQIGTGTTGNDYDLTLTGTQYERSLEFRTTNYAAFAENIFQFGNRLKIIPGIRFENIRNNVAGYINTTESGILSTNARTRNIFLFGIGSDFSLSKNANLYANYSRAYRPVTFSELTPSATTEVIDVNLKDASGYNCDLGYRGSIKNYLNFDIGLFYLRYNNRIGTLTQNGAPFKTNIGASVSKGIESYVEVDVVRIFTQNSKMGNLSLFASNSIINATYVEWNNPAIVSDPTKAIENKRVENAPRYIHRTGATYVFKEFSATFQFSAVGDVYTDAANTEVPNATSTIGKLPGYKLMDASFNYRFMKHYNFKAGINNITNEKYATRRAGGYPGPGILPGNGRTIFISFGATI
jgi:Fe(3+) dicitrate transport protein